MSPILSLCEGNRNPSPAEITRCRLEAIRWAAENCRPTFGGIFILHTHWREIELQCAGDPDLLALHRQADRVIGGYRQGGAR